MTDSGIASGRTVLAPAGGGEAFELLNPRLVIAGYTGRDAAAVARHIEELEAIGVPAPPSVPAFYELDARLVTTGPVIEVTGGATSGEVEPVLVRHQGSFYLGVGSDHTDRDTERRDIAASKAACPKPLGRLVQPLPGEPASWESVLGWDRIAVESSVDGAVYQAGLLAALRSPADLLARLAESGGERRRDLVLFGGTLPLLAGEFVAGKQWQLSLTMPGGVVLSHSYEVQRRVQ